MRNRISWIDSWVFPPFYTVELGRSLSIRPYPPPQASLQIISTLYIPVAPTKPCALLTTPLILHSGGTQPN